VESLAKTLLSSSACVYTSPSLNESMYIHHQGKEIKCYVHNQCKYIFTLSSRLPHPLNDNVCSAFIYINTKKSTKHMICTQPSDIFRNHCTHPGNIWHFHGIYSTTQLSLLSFEWINVYTSSGEGNQMLCTYSMYIYIHFIKNEIHKNNRSPPVRSWVFMLPCYQINIQQHTVVVAVKNSTYKVSVTF
jgi:hypothetical protein